MPALPEAFVERLEAIVPAERFEGVVAAFRRPAATGFRVNTLKATRSDVRASLEREGVGFHDVSWKPDAFWVEAEERAALLASAAYQAQAIYVQNLASMVPPLALAPKPGERVLDLAAAPGSKTLQMACMMEDEGEIAAVEVVKGRFFKLRANLEAQGATAVRTFLQDGTKVWRYRPEHFDRVLLDAPCSSEGRFHLSDPQTYAYWSPRKIKEMARKQRRLLYSAVQCLKPGGTLVYSTCSFAPEENEAILDKTLRRFDGALHLEPLSLELENMQPPLESWQGRPFKSALRHARRLLPTETMEGFFVAKLRKTASTSEL
ncbi:MAG: RsmB/NOP family class I SAM-dependent RNA methyltransferase [Rhodothermales bacterium]